MDNLYILQICTSTIINIKLIDYYDIKIFKTWAKNILKNLKLSQKFKNSMFWSAYVFEMHTGVSP